MKILQVPFCFAPDPIGGTEVYVTALALDLQKLGVEVVIAAPAATTRAYRIDGLRVLRFATSEKVRDVAELYGDGDPVAAREFGRILDDEKPDVVHLHAFTRAVSLRVVLACKNRGILVVFTYHTPTVSCQRGTMMLWGETPCDGKVDLRRCTACTLQSRGLPRTFARIAGSLPPDFGERLGAWGFGGGVWTAMRMSELLDLRLAAFREMAGRVDHLVAVCDWVRAVILANDVSSTKVSVCRHGIVLCEARISEGPRAACSISGEETRLAFVGRFDPTKGIHVLIDAFRALPSLRMRLDIFGVAQSEADRAYGRRLVALAANDSRIGFCGALASLAVVERLRDYDFLVVPSQWMETGPLVVLEAFAAGVPVIGTRVGGIAELVHDNVDGLLIDPSSRLAWPETLRRVVEDGDLRIRLRASVRPPRRSDEVADEMLALYRSIVGAPHGGTAKTAWRRVKVGEPG
jgi:glycosyltransferase involved in cell wall biosynthesis